MKETYHGSCHCGAVRFAAAIDLDKGTLKCNCSICTKARNWLAVPAEDFGPVTGESELTEYRFGAERIHHLFCRHCGMRPFGWSESPELGGKFYAVNVACLDDVDLEALIAAPVTCIDGRNDNWRSPPAETRHL